MNKDKLKILTIKPILTKEEIKEKEGDYFDDSQYIKHHKVITTNTDVYGLEEDGTKKLLLKFRKYWYYYLLRNYMQYYCTILLSII